MLEEECAPILHTTNWGRVCASLNVNDEIFSHPGSHSTSAINQQMGGPESNLSTSQKALTVCHDPWEACGSWQWVICHVVMSDGGWDDEQDEGTCSHHTSGAWCLVSPVSVFPWSVRRSHVTHVIGVWKMWINVGIIRSLGTRIVN